MKRAPIGFDATTAISDVLGVPEGSSWQFAGTPADDTDAAPAFTTVSAVEIGIDGHAAAIDLQVNVPASDILFAVAIPTSSTDADSVSIWASPPSQPAETQILCFGVTVAASQAQEENADQIDTLASQHGSAGSQPASFAPVAFVPAVSASLAPALSASHGVDSLDFGLGADVGAIPQHVEPPDVGARTLTAAAPSPAIVALPVDFAMLANPPSALDEPVTNGQVGSGGATAAQVQQALDESGLSVNGSGIKVGVLSDSFNDLGGAAADEADGALPPASDIQVVKDLSSGGTDEGRAMMQIIHDIAPGANLAFYTAFDSEQDFANGILALAAAGSKVIVDDVSYFDEPFFQNGIVAQAIQTVEAEGVTYVTAAGNEASNAYQAAWTPIAHTSYDGSSLSDIESFGGSPVQTVTVGGNVPLILEWNQPYGGATSDLEILAFQNGSLVSESESEASSNNPWAGIELPAGTYQIAIEDLSGPNPGLIKEIALGDGIPVTISGANIGTVYGHAMTPGAITAGAVSAADTPAFGDNAPTSESFSSSGAGTELLFANNGTALSSPDVLSPVAVSGIDDIKTTVPGGLSDFYGTSAASASLAGVAALMLAANPDLTPAQVEQIIEETAVPMATPAVSGAGLVQVDAAIAAIPFPGDLGAISASLLTQGDVENNSTTDLVWRASNAQTTIWAVDTSGTVTVTSLGAIGTTWTILNSGDYLSNTTTQMLTDYTPNGTMTLWWVSNGTLAGINLGQHWPNISYVDSGTFMETGVDDILVKNNVNNGMYVWWINSTNNTLTGVNLGSHWGNISYVASGNFFGNGSDDMLVKNNVDNGMYVWWVNTTNHTLNGINLGSHWGNTSYVASGNFLANGSEDMLVKNNVDNHMYVWWVNTTNDTLQGIDLGAHWSGIKFLASGHFAGSGDEMLVQNTTDDHVYMWWLNTTNDTLSGVDLGAISAQWHVAATADYNADGYTDIIWHNSLTGQVQLWLMGGYSGPTNGAQSATTTIDVSGDVVAFGALHQPAKIEVDATLELRSADSGTLTFEGPTGTLTLDHASAFNGQVVGFSGNGNASTSDVIDLKDIAFGPGTTASYVGNASGGILTVGDARHDSTNISLLGNYENSTFAVASDGAGGTSVVDLPLAHLLSEGQFVFKDFNATDDASVSVSPQDGGADYVGSFIVNALSTGDRRESVDWHFDPGPGAVQHVMQSYNISIAGPGSDGGESPATRSLSVTIGAPGSDAFLFKPGFGTDIIANLKGSDTIELDGFSSVSDSSGLRTLLTEAQSGQAQPLFHMADGGHDTIINLGNHDSVILQNVSLASLHMSNFIVHPPLIG